MREWSLAGRELGLLVLPHDDRLRLSLAASALETGRLERARSLVSPLVDRGAPLAAAGALRLEVDRRILRQANPDDRPRLRARMLRELQAVDPAQLKSGDAERLAALGRDLGAPEVAAKILDSLARRDEARVLAATAAHVAIGRHEDAATLHAAWAERLAASAALAHALRALEYAEADSARSALAMFTRLRRRLQDEPALLERGLALARVVDPPLALELAEALVRLRPGELAVRQQLASIALQNHERETALRALFWIAGFTGHPEDAARALRLATTQWDSIERGSTTRACRPVSSEIRLPCTTRHRWPRG